MHHLDGLGPIGPLGLDHSNLQALYPYVQWDPRAAKPPRKRHAEWISHTPAGGRSLRGTQSSELGRRETTSLACRDLGGAGYSDTWAGCPRIDERPVTPTRVSRLSGLAQLGPHEAVRARFRPPRWQPFHWRVTVFVDTYRLPQAYQKASRIGPMVLRGRVGGTNPLRRRGKPRKGRT